MTLVHSQDVADTDDFVFNDKFTSKLYKVKISTVAASKEGEPEKAETMHKVGGGGGTSSQFRVTS